MADKYTVKLYAHANRNLDDIYDYIANTFLDSQKADEITDTIEGTILSLETLPRRGSIRKYGIYANKGYRQLFVKNYIVIYKVYEEIREVHIETVCYVRKNV